MAEWQERFGERLRRLREAAGYSQEDLAERAGLSANAISALERGERKRPYPDTLRRLADALQLEDRARSDLIASLQGRAAGEAAAPGVAPPHPVIELPGEPTPFIGRDREAGVVQHLLAHAEGRLLTLVGPGGVGKTRLALHVARSMTDQFADGVAWVELAPLADPALVLPAIAQALGLDEPSRGDPATVLRDRLRDRRLLLVLDNVEHLLAAAPDLARLLLACANLHILATSRSPLRIRGEQEYLVPPLELPPAGPAPDHRAMAGVSSVQFFVWQAQRKSPSFALTPDNAATVAEICRRLDGLPLALELVAARIRALSPPELLARLDRLMPLLVGGSRDLPHRQQTMRAAIAWSYELLSPPGQALFRRLSVFAGGWALEAAEAVDPDHAEDVFDLLDALVEQSLVTVTYEDAGTRYGMLEPIRQFAQELLDAGDEAEDARRRHAAYYAAFAERSGKALEGRSGQAAVAGSLDREYDNLRAAVAWSERAPDGAESGLRIASSLWRYWEMRWRVDEGGKWLASALARSEGQPAALRAKALSAAGNIARDLANHDQAAAYHQQSLALRRDLDDIIGVASSLNNLGVVARDRGDAREVVRLGQESLALFRQAGDAHGAAIALIGLGGGAGQLGDLDQARAYYDESLALFRAEGDAWHIAWVLTFQADLLARHGDHAAARPLAVEALALHRAANEAWGQATALGVFGRAALADGDPDAAAAFLAEALQLLVGARVERAVPTVLDGLADVLLAMGEPQRAARLAGSSEALRAFGGADRIPGAATDAVLALGAGPHAVAWSEGRALTREQVFAEALAIAGDIAGP